MKHELVQMMIDNKIVKIKEPQEEPFTLKSGKTSRLFFDVKEASLNPVILEEIIKHIDLSFVSQFEKIASVAVGGIPLATALSLKTGIPQIIIRSEKHDRGTESKIIGSCNNKECLLIEDVATSGGSLVTAIKDIRKAGGSCAYTIVVIDREEGSDVVCDDNGIFLRPLLTKKNFGIFDE